MPKKVPGNPATSATVPVSHVQVLVDLDGNRAVPVLEVHDVLVAGVSDEVCSTTVPRVRTRCGDACCSAILRTSATDVQREIERRALAAGSGRRRRSRVGARMRTPHHDALRVAQQHAHAANLQLGVDQRGRRQARSGGAATMHLRLVDGHAQIEAGRASGRLPESRRRTTPSRRGSGRWPARWWTRPAPRAARRRRARVTRAPLSVRRPSLSVASPVTSTRSPGVNGAPSTPMTCTVSPPTCTNRPSPGRGRGRRPRRGGPGVGGPQARRRAPVTAAPSEREQQREDVADDWMRLAQAMFSRP